MPNTLFTKRLIAVDADRFKRVEFQTVRSRDGNRVDLQATAQTGIAVNPNFPQQTREFNMKIAHLVEEFKNLSIAERCEFIDQASAVLATTKATPSHVDNVFAGADERNVRAFAGILAQARRYGIEPAKGRKLAAWEVDRSIRESGRDMSPEERINLKTRLAMAGIME